jgi:hypothetical protein
MSQENAFAIIKEEAQEGKLDEDIVEKLTEAVSKKLILQATKISPIFLLISQSFQLL